MDIAPDLLEQIVEHARREWPKECCGLIAVRDGRAVGVHPVANAHQSPYRFEMDRDEQAGAVFAIQDAGDDIGGVYHSHTRSAPEPSMTDVNIAAEWWPAPETEWLIVGLSSADDDPEIRSWLISRDGDVEEAEVRVGAP